jgi:tetratricopeptide (TPR) repeat protein
MRDLLQPTIAALDSFVDEHDHLVMILRSPASDALPITTTLEGLDGSHPSDLIWLVTDAFDDPDQYVTKVVGAFSARHALVRIAAAREGLKAWPDIPAEIMSRDVEPSTRLRKLAVFSRDLLPIPSGGNNVWVFYPLELSNPQDFAQLMCRVVAHEFPNPWCHHLRFIIREDPSDRMLSSALRGVRSVIIHEPDLGPEAVAKTLEADANDESLPIEQRLNSVFLLAGGDLAHNRLHDALDKYALLLQYYAPASNYTMAAAALNGMGEVYARQGDDENANEAFQSALVPATQGEHPPLQIFLNVCINLAQLRMKQANWPEASGYWDCVQQLAVATRDAAMKIRALDQLGYCQYKSSQLEEADKHWTMGACLAADYENRDLQAALLERRRALYVETGQITKELEVAKQLAALGR